MGVHYHGVPLDEDGMDVTALASMLEELASQNIRPRYLYTIPSVQNPTGSVMPQERRQHILETAQRCNVPIFEDDCYSDLVWEGDRPATFYGLADGKGVIYCGSFSKSLAPALRVGYLVAPWEVLSHILPYKTDAGSGALEQMVLADFCPEHYENHVTALTQHLAQKCDIMCAALDRYFGASADYTRPKGGIFVWVTMPDHVDSMKLATVAGAEGISINPGPDWSIAPEAPHQFRLCFGYPDAAIIEEGVMRLAKICQKEFGVPLAIDNT
jgi:2-aminoadipate transaminase